MSSKIKKIRSLVLRWVPLLPRLSTKTYVNDIVWNLVLDLYRRELTHSMFGAPAYHMVRLPLEGPTGKGMPSSWKTLVAGNVESLMGRLSCPDLARWCGALTQISKWASLGTARELCWHGSSGCAGWRS